MIVQIAAEHSYLEGLRDGSQSRARTDAVPAIEDVLRQMYMLPSDTSYGRGQRVTVRRIAERFGIDLER